MSPTDSTIEKIQKNLSHNFQEHSKTLQDADKAITNFIFVITTGTLLLSVNIINNTDTVFILKGFLLTTWICLAIVVMSQIIGHHFVIKHSKRNLDMMNEHTASGFQDHPNFYTVKIQNDKIINNAYWAVHFTNKVSYCFLALGIVCALIFLTGNFYAQQEIKRVKQEQENVKQALEQELLIRQIAHPKEYR